MRIRSIGFSPTSRVGVLKAPRLLSALSISPLLILPSLTVSWILAGSTVLPLIDVAGVGAAGTDPSFILPATCLTLPLASFSISSDSDTPFAVALTYKVTFSVLSLSKSSSTRTASPGFFIPFCNSCFRYRFT